jgi:hypothetical protein
LQGVLLNIGLAALHFGLKNSGVSYGRSLVREKNAYSAKCSYRKTLDFLKIAP